MTHTVDNTSGGADDPETVDRAIDYQATTESGSRGDGVYYTNVTNAPANKINYTIEKIWLDEDGNNVTDSKEPTDLTFYLYRMMPGSRRDRSLLRMRAKRLFTTRPTPQHMSLIPARMQRPLPIP